MSQSPSSERVSPATLSHALGQWSEGRGALYERLADGIESAIDRGDLPAGALLPAERAAAVQLSVSRGTVVAAYQQLRDKGLVERRQGSGTRIAVDARSSTGRGGARARTPTATADYAAGVRARRLTGRFTDPGRDVIDLGVSLLMDTAGLPPELFQVDLERVTRLAHGHGYHPLGLPALRRRLADWHTEAGLPTDPAQIVVTVGAQQAIALTARLLVTPGDVIAVESPTFPGAIDAYSRAGARFATMGTDSGGVRVGDVARVIDHARPRLVYLIPTCHNPTGTVLVEHRRQQIADLAARSETWIVEDESLAPLTFDGEPGPPPLAERSPGARVITIGSMSKLLWGGLRLGWIRAPERVAARIGRLKAAQDLGNCSVSQVITLDLIDHLPELLTARRRMLAERAALLTDRLGALLPEWRFAPPRGGLSLWVQLPSGTGDAFSAAAHDAGVAVLPGSATSADEGHLDHLRLSFANEPALLEAAVERLSHAWDAYSSRPSGAEPAAAAVG